LRWVKRIDTGGLDTTVLALQGSLRYHALVPIEGLATQLRKGVIGYCVLAMLRDTSRYGGELVQLLREKDGLLVSEGTIYPLLSRMRAEGLVETEWRETSGGSPRRYYRLTRSGQKAVGEFRGEWLRFRATVDSIFENEGGRKR
jgi:PadR family transcriptional regulator PadR